MSSVWTNSVQQWRDLGEKLDSLTEVIQASGQLLVDTVKADGIVFACGNGGSAAQATHLTSELVGRYKAERDPLRAVPLNGDAATLTCIVNDYPPEELYARQVRGIGRDGDLLVGLSTSGKSQNIIKAFQDAQKLGMKTIALLGEKAGPDHTAPGFGVADVDVIVPHALTARIQEVHILIIHAWCEMIDEAIVGK